MNDDESVMPQLKILTYPKQVIILLYVKAYETL